MANATFATSRDLTTAPIGTPHRTAKCLWCAAALVVGQVAQLRCWICPVDWARQVKYATFVKPLQKDHAKLLGVSIGTRVCLNVPLPSQAAIEERIAAFRIAYPGKRLNLTWGGQAGPGKSAGVRWLLYRRSLNTARHEALLLRENWEQLEKTHIRKMKEELPKMGARLVDRTAIFHNEAYIDCGHMADQEAIGRYLSTGYGIIAPDEASLYPVDTDGTPVLAELSTRARETWMGLDGFDSVPLFIPTTNPGGPSAPWLLDMCIDHAPDLEKYPALADLDADGEPIYNPDHWQYQAARLDDNPYMREDYATTDLATLSKFRYQQLRLGDWHVFSGQFFSQWTDTAHVRDLGTPSGVRWFRSMDWGYNAPGCFIWWAVLPDGRLYLRDEWKFQQTDEPDVAKQVKKTDAQHGIAKVEYTAGDPAVFNQTGATHKNRGFIGLSIGDTLGHYGVPIIKADNDRLNGWKRCHALLRNAPDGMPWAIWHPDCRYGIRSIASARSDKKNPDDVDTNSDDHYLDSWRYGSMSSLVGSVLSDVKPYVKPPEGSPAYYMERMRAKVSRRFGRVA